MYLHQVPTRKNQQRIQLSITGKFPLHQREEKEKKEKKGNSQSKSGRKKKEKKENCKKRKKENVRLCMLGLGINDIQLKLSLDVIKCQGSLLCIFFSLALIVASQPLIEKKEKKLREAIVVLVSRLSLDILFNVCSQLIG